jgi:hypothetical protein
MKTRLIFCILLAIAGLAGAGAKAQGPVPARDPELRAVLEKLGATSLAFRAQFHNFIAEEHDLQKRYKPNGELDGERRIVSDYYMVTLPSGPSVLYDFREVLQVDGKDVRRRQESVVKMLNRRGGEVGKEIERLKRESNRYELFLGRAFLSNVSLLLPLYATPDHQKHTEFRLLTEPSLPPDELLLEFKELGDDTILRYGGPGDDELRPLNATGRFNLAKTDCRILKADVSVVNWRQEDGTSVRLHYVVEYRPAPDGQMLPRRRLVFVSHPKWRNGLIAESEATYSNFRRFSADSKILSWELP